MFKKIKEIVSKESQEILDYNGYIIIPVLQKEKGSYITNGIIRKNINGIMKENSFLRTDTFTNKDDLIECIHRKGRIIVDEFGDNLFEKDWL